MAEFITPDFLENHSPDEVFGKMKKILPADIDLSEGGHGWNMTRPTALVIAELCEFILPEVIKLIFPEWSYGAFLDAHAKSSGMTRRAAIAATGELEIVGTAGTVIPAGSLFSTATVNNVPSVDYRVVETAKIPSSGSLTVNIQCTQTGIIGNTPSNTIVMMSSRISGVKMVNNPEAVTGGTEEEDDASLIQRIMEYDRSKGDSFTGSVADYKRWATSVDGVGSAMVIPAQDDTGLVTIILTDANGAPATESLCETVYNYIMKPDNPEERLAPCNASISVIPPHPIQISIKATVLLADDATLESVKAAYMDRLEAYLPVSLADGEIKYSRLAAALAATEGASDFFDLQFGVETDTGVDYGTSNIAVTEMQLPTIEADALILTAGSV